MRRSHDEAFHSRGVRGLAGRRDGEAIVRRRHAAAQPTWQPAYYVSPFNWTGFYVGINGGYGFGKSNWTDTGLCHHRRLQFHRRVGRRHASVTICRPAVGPGRRKPTSTTSWIKGTDATVCCETKNIGSGPARGRIGYALIVAALPHRRRGLWRRQDDAGRLRHRQTDTRFGWTAGGGLEYAFMGAWSAKVEYLYVDLGKASCNAASCGSAPTSRSRPASCAAGVNYHF